MTAIDPEQLQTKSVEVQEALLPIVPQKQEASAQTIEAEPLKEANLVIREDG